MPDLDTSAKVTRNVNRITTGKDAEGLHIHPDVPLDPQLEKSHCLEEFREAEGRENRKRRLHELWKSLPQALAPSQTPMDRVDDGNITAEKAESLKAMYDSELLLHCSTNPTGSQPPQIGWKEFKNYAQSKEAELWHIFHHELDLDGNGRLDRTELQSALSKAGIHLSISTIDNFMQFISSQSRFPDNINFRDFRDFFILLPRKISPAEIYQYYEMRRYLGDDGRGAARVTMEGDVSLSAEDRPPEHPAYKMTASEPRSSSTSDPDEEYDELDEDEEEGVKEHSFLDGYTSLKFLLAGGIAGAELGGPITVPGQARVTGVRIIGNAVARIYSEGGILAFWTGNGLSVAKIFPESAIKFFAYESSKRAFAKYYDLVEDSRDISGFSRFLSGGIGGISSQLTIYPIETLKTQMMSSTAQKRNLIGAMRHVYQLGGLRAYYRGLTVIRYSAIDMSTFEALKLGYQRSTGKQEPGVLALLAFGSISGSVGASSVYPLNLVRTRLQASGSTGHPQRYSGVWDVVQKTYERDGWRGFYRGLFPTLAKASQQSSLSSCLFRLTHFRLSLQSAKWLLFWCKVPS
ncbi:mitochondrial carrier domain-containing protein [Gymnopilus junonius]|uniref:Mitochondrial carrier domain-containing protein n=1 Tax=Gymnopilus junonius TaxID=109634 RepID=A0A9P5P350_GYMJU|nr:mitochondrial carrier domain-containing protein [Gymnopilus junonius]